jgi:hypothetical protein
VRQARYDDHGFVEAVQRGRQPLARPSLGRVVGTNDSLATKARWLGAKRQSAARGVGWPVGLERLPFDLLAPSLAQRARRTDPTHSCFGPGSG